MLTGQNGILNRATEAKNSTGTAQVDEQVKLSVAEALSNGLGIITDDNLKNALDSNVGKEKYELKGDSTKGWTIKANDKTYNISGNGEISGEDNKGENSDEDQGKNNGNGTMPYLPDTTKFEYVEGTDLTTGLVIREKSTGSEYVWVEVPRTLEVYPNAGINIKNFEDEESTNIENDLHIYTKDYRNETVYSDIYYDASDDSYEANKSDWYASKEEYNEDKKKMLKSVYQNEGFWVGRYEAGINENRMSSESSGIPSTIPLTKANLYPYTFVTRTQAKVLAERVESGSHNSSLMYGVQWDLMLKYIEEKKKNQIPEISKSLISDSTNIGNYSDSEFTLNSGKYGIMENNNPNLKYDVWNLFTVDLTDYVEKSYKKEKKKYGGILITTGATEATNLQNIYDIAGNVREITLENNNSTTYGPCVYRGGAAYQLGSVYTAMHRSSYYDSYCAESDGSLGFRISIY